MLPYAEIASPAKPWLLAPAPVRRLIGRLDREATRLDDPENTKAIFQGIITSADHIFHLKKLGKGRYSYTPRQSGKKLAPVVVEIEDAIMKPLVSGAEAKRFIEPDTDTYLLFPYRVDSDGARLLTPDEMVGEFPKAWRYLKPFEKELRARDGGKTDSDGKWFGYVYPKNLDKQETPKLLVPRLVANLGCFGDASGKYYCDNVDVGGVVPRRSEDVWWLAAILNVPTSNLIFSWLTKPFRGEYKSANKQFIAPLPVPKGSRSDKAAVMALAKGMQERRSLRVELRADLNERLTATSRVNWPLERLLPDVRAIPEIEQALPRSVPASERKRWVDEQRKADEETALARIDSLIRLDSEATVDLRSGKLTFLIDEQEAARVFVSEAEAPLIAAQCRAIALDFQPSGKGDAKRLTDRLRKLAVTAEPALEEQIIAIGQKLAELGEVLHDDEKQLHELTALLFNLTPEEEQLVKQGRN